MILAQCCVIPSLLSRAFLVACCGFAVGCVAVSHVVAACGRYTVLCGAWTKREHYDCGAHLSAKIIAIVHTAT